jgi:hypothetical protein
MQTHFLHPGNPKKRKVGSFGTDVLCKRMVLRTNNVPFERLKMRLGEVEEAIFQCVESASILCFCILDIDKSDLNKVA